MTREEKENNNKTLDKCRHSRLMIAPLIIYWPRT